MNTVMTLAVALVATILIEYGVLLLLGERRKRVLLSSIVVNILTNVSLNLCLLWVGNGWTALALGECAVVVVEMLWYLYFVREWKQALVYSLLCNAISFLSGVLFQLLIAIF